MPFSVLSNAFTILFISAPFYLVSCLPTTCGISHCGRNMVSDNAAVIQCPTASAQRERENYSLAPNLENFMDIDRSGFDSFQTGHSGHCFQGAQPGSQACSSVVVIGMGDTVISSSSRCTQNGERWDFKLESCKGLKIVTCFPIILEQCFSNRRFYKAVSTSVGYGWVRRFHISSKFWRPPLNSSNLEDICPLCIILQYLVSRKLKKITFVRVNFEGFQFNYLNYSSSGALS